MSEMTAAPPVTDDAWWPSRYGPDDEAGALNEISPSTVVRAAGLVRTGRVYDLAHVLDGNIPAFPGRTFRQFLTTSAHQLNRRASGAGLEGLGRNNVNWVVEYVSAPSQMGTHVDGLNHLQIGDRTYNGHRLVDLVEEYGTNRLGIETLPQVVTRGVLLDIAAVHQVERLERGYVITPADVEAAAARQTVTVDRGDAVLFHTGWGRWWGVDNGAYVDGEPGPGRAVGAWLVDHHVAITGCDTWSFGSVPSEDPDEPFAVPQTLNVKHGVVVLENLRLAELAEARVSEFMFVVSHAKLRGATGAWVTPLAIV
jgi:kynurenine formamidase